MASSNRVRAIYDRQAANYDAVGGMSGLEDMRSRLFAQAVGNVLELGIGTGATLRHYRNISGLTGLDLSERMLERARARSEGLPYPVRLEQQDFQTLAFPDASFETITSSLGLCGIPDPTQLFAEVRRVLKPGGALLALEHVRPPTFILGLGTDLIDPVWDYVVGCHLNRPTVALLKRAGFQVTIHERRVLGAVVSLTAKPI
jgi:ubiquinone/menaquinone biosynthesis C-methylase UbiE